MTLVSGAILAWGACYASTVTWAILRRARPSRPPGHSAPPPRVLLVRPCSGDEPQLLATLRSSVVDPERLAVRFAVATQRDAAMNAARDVAAELCALGHDVSVRVTGARGPNRKADQIARALADAPPHDVVVVADSDVLLVPGDLRALLAALDEPGVTAAWSPPVEDGAAIRFGDVLSRSVLRATMQSFTLLAGLDPGGLVGKLLAVRRDALDGVGSFAALVTYLGEDMELARRLRARGDRVVARGIARSVPRGRSPREVLDRYARWIGVIRAQRPHLLWTYPLFFFSAFPVGGVALLLGHWLTASLFLGARIGVALTAAPGQWRSPAQALFEALPGDAVLAVAFTKALFTRTISWRGTTLRMTRTLLEADER